MAVKRKNEAGAPAFTGAQLLTFDRYREQATLRLPGAGAKRKGHQGFPSSLDSNLSFIATLAAGTAAPSLHRRTALRKGNGYRFSWVQKKGGGGLHRKKGRAALLCRPCTRCIVKPQRA